MPSPSLDIVYVSHNRRSYTEASFQALIDNTNWNLVDHLHIRDDGSLDGTLELLIEMVGKNPACATEIVSDRFGGPVNALNSALDRCDSEVVAKIDSDCLTCPGWLEHMLAVLNAHPHVDVLGMEPGFGDPVAPLDVPRTARAAPHVGGIGLIRTRIFAHARPQQDKRFFGWTAFQRRHARTAWITPALPCFLLDHIDISPWRELAEHYIDVGWSRPWSSYFVAPREYYQWWLDLLDARKMEMTGV